MNRYDCDLFVIGAGSGGVRAARMSANMGARVVIVEERYLGGTCVNVGCVPKKLFVYASHFSEELQHAQGFGWHIGDSTFDWKEFINNKNREIERLNGVYRNLLDNSGAQIVDGRAVLVDENTVSVNNRTYRAKWILIATGGWPKTPDIPGREHTISSNQVFHLEKMPQRVVVVGGGYIAVEFACILNGLGSDTTLVYRGPLFLRGFDDEIRKFLAAEMIKKGVKLKLGTSIHEIVSNGKEKTVQFSDGGNQNVDSVLYAIGRSPNVKGLGLEKLGIKTRDNGAIIVDENYQTSVPSIYAIGDVTDRVNLTPVALAEGAALAKALFEDSPTVVDYDKIPTCVFSQPPLASVGVTEEQARQEHQGIEVFRSQFTPLKHTISDSPEKMLMKMIVEKNSGRILGVHMVGSDAAEIIQGIAIALKAGATKSVFDATVGIHPTAAEEFVTMRDAF